MRDSDAFIIGPLPELEPYVIRSGSNSRDIATRARLSSAVRLCASLRGQTTGVVPFWSSRANPEVNFLRVDTFEFVSRADFLAGLTEPGAKQLIRTPEEVIVG